MTDMSAPDDRDWAAARAAFAAGGVDPLQVPNFVWLVAAAFEEVRAAERERVVAPVRALAEELERAAVLPTLNEFDRGVAAHERDLADRLRAVLPPQPEEPQP